MNELPTPLKGTIAEHVFDCMNAHAELLATPLPFVSDCLKEGAEYLVELLYVDVMSERKVGDIFEPVTRKEIDYVKNGKVRMVWSA